MTPASPWRKRGAVPPGAWSRNLSRDRGVMSGYPRLFEPLELGSHVVKNRIVSSGHDTVMVEHGRITDRLVAYHEARAAGGVGLIVVQVAAVHETARYTTHVLMATDDGCVEGYRRLADAVHAHGTTIVGQLFHPGREVMDLVDGNLAVAVAPSAVPNERFHVMPRALRRDEVLDVIQGYAEAATRLMRAGMDGVEIVASHGYLPAQFLNPRTNVRLDEYGGDEANRRRFLAEVLTSVRERLGSGVLGLRISLDDHDPGGLSADEARAAIVALDRARLFDYVSVTTGTSATLAGSDHIAPTMHLANGYVAPLASSVKEVVSVPVIVAGRINQPQEAERIIARGEADACVMTRALICDPNVANLARDGRADEIRACVACNQACIGHFHAGFAISCIQHPETGRELTLGRRVSAALARRVLVIGGGPAGLKAAAVAAERGHRVALHEAAAQVGGLVLLAQRLPGRDEFGGVATNLEREARRAGVEIVTHSAADPALVASLAPDLVVVATGSRPYRPPLEIMGSPHLLDVDGVLLGGPVPRGHVVVVDWRGDWTGVGVARLLAERGNRVTLATPGYGAGESLQQYVRDEQLAALARSRVTVLALVRPYGVDDDSVYLQHVLTEELVVLEGVAAVVLATGRCANDDLVDGLGGPGDALTVIGDCAAPRTVEEAVLDGLRVGSSL